MALPCVRCVFAAVVESAAKLFVELGLGQVALDVRHFRCQPLPRGLVDVVGVELRAGVARTSFSACRKGGRASFPQFPPTGPRRSARSSPAAPWCATGCRAPGITRRLVRSPLAPKITMAQGSAGLACRRGGTRSPARSELFESADCRACVTPRHSASLSAPRFFRLWFGINGPAALDVPAEAEAHGRQHLFAEGVLLARAEAGVERRGQHVGRHRFLDRGLDGPAALAGILDEAGERLAAAGPSPARRR